MMHRGKRSGLLRLLACILSVLLIGGALMISAFAVEAPPEPVLRTVRVAFPSQSGMSGVGSDGDLVGYNYDYLQELAEYAGWNVEYITFEDMSANDGITRAMQMVMQGEADLIGPMLRSDAVEKMFDFPEDNYGVVYTTLCALEKSNITSVNYTKQAPLRVAVYASAATRNQEITDYLNQLNVEYELIPCQTGSEQLELLQRGEADLVSSITLSYFGGTRSVAQFAPRPYYFAATKGNAGLLAELDAAIKTLNYTRPYLQQQLQEKYFGDISSGYVLTDEELRHMEELQTLHVLCASKNDAPYVRQTEEGETVGMLVSLLNDFAKINHIEVSYTFCEKLSAVETEWRTGQYDCLIGIPFSSQYCVQNDLVRTEAVTSVDMVLFAKQTVAKPREESTVAVFSRLKDLVNLNGFAKVLTYNDPTQCYEAVEKGEADYGCSDRLLTEYTLLERDSMLATVPLLGEKEDICIAVARTMGGEFLSALNKYIHTLPDNTKTTYLTEGSHHQAKSGLRNWIHENPLKATAIVSAIAVLIASTVMFAFFASRSRRKNKQLEKANAAKSEFLARMSHDIRTPMNAIVGYLDIARDTEGCPERVEHCIDNSTVAAKHLLQLINDVLDMSSIESGKIKIASEEFDVSRVITDATTIFYQTAKTKGVRFETQIRSITDEWVVGDPLRVTQIVMNLLSNAVKFTPENGLVRFIVEQSGISESGSDMTLTVSDTGIGMAKEYMSRLFQPFEQESAGTARQYGGSGLGLSIVHSFVTMMGGTIQVESEQNKGTTFTVRLHFDKAVKHPASALTIQSESKINALIVSGNEAVAESEKAALTELGVRADVVTDAAYALKRIRRRATGDYPYTVCILDWNELGTDPAPIVSAIRADADNQNLTLLAAGYDITEFEAQAMAAGADACAKAPIFRSAWIAILQSLKSVKERAPLQKEKTHADMRGKRIILAEDNAFNQEIAVTLLGKAGITVDAAENGQKAVELFEAAPEDTYDFILMDIQMPVMDGYAATKAIRALARKDAKEIPIIAMTANAFAEDVATALECGMNAHIAKPVDYEKLFSVLSEITEAKQR